MAKFNFYLKGAKNAVEYRRSTKPALILLFVSHDGKRSRFTTGQSIAPNCWDFKNQRCKASATNAASLNDYLANFQASIEETLLGLKAEGVTPSTDLLKSEVNLKKEKKAKISTLVEGFEIFLAERSASYKALTIVALRRNLNRIKAFEAAKRTVIRLDTLGKKEIDALLLYLEKTCNLSKNTIADVVKTIKAVLNWLVESEMLENFKMPSLKVSWEDVQNVYLDETELAHLWALDLTTKPRLERVRDLFLVGCWTGLRFSDFTKLKPENIIGNLAQIQTQKTGQVVTIPIHPIVRQILEKYEGNLPREISNQKMNDFLKEIAQLASFDEMGIDSKTKGGVKSSTFRAKWERISTHTARRSFATNLYKMRQMSTVMIMKITGHKTESAFLKYIKVDQEESATQLANLWERNSQAQTKLEAV